MNKVKLKLKGKQLRDLQDRIAIVQYALEKTLTDCFIREEIFELVTAAQDAASEIERVLTL
jgi:hypothetical protein